MLSSYDSFLLGTVLHRLVPSSGVIACCKKQAKLKRQITKIDSEVDKALDVRTMLRMQSLLLAHTRVMFERRHHALFKL